jgi:HPt (histidine-containing phosphotransfer) domain-containing protein
MENNDKAKNFLELFQSECVKNELIDEIRFHELYSEIGTIVLADIVISFSKTLDESFISLQETLQNHDAERSFRICHKLKGSSQLLGFTKLAQSCEKICASFKSLTKDVETETLQRIMGNVATIKEAIIFAQNS